eukprot:Skav219834  [mRNA]  locus=scaffold859:52253:52480:+ [translate_table: standard]
MEDKEMIAEFFQLECEEGLACRNFRAAAEVEEASFETLGRRFPFQQPEQCRHFAWEDGTIQRVDRIHKTLRAGVR